MFDPKDGDFASLIDKLDGDSLKKLQEQSRDSLREHRNHSSVLKQDATADLVPKKTDPAALKAQVPPVSPQDGAQTAFKTEDTPQKSAYTPHRRHSAPQGMSDDPQDPDPLHLNGELLAPSAQNQQRRQERERKGSSFAPLIVFAVIFAVVIIPEMLADEGFDPMLGLFVLAVILIMGAGFIGNLKKRRK